MAVYKVHPEYGELRMVHAVVDFLEIRGPGHKTMKIGLLGMDVENDLGCPGVADIQNSVLIDCDGNFRGFPGLPDDINKELVGEGRRICNGMLQPPLRRLTTPVDRDHLTLASAYRAAAAAAEAEESFAERRAAWLMAQEKKIKEKAEKKRMKKHRQKERKRLEKQQKEQQNADRSVEENGGPRQSKAKENKGVNEEFPPKIKSSKDTDSSDSSDEYSSVEEGSDEDGDTDDDEKLDLNSLFVSKAANIARQKVEQARAERKERKKSPVKETPQPPPQEKSNGVVEQQQQQEGAAAASNSSTEDYLKISTELALHGNTYASAGQFDIAVKYFTDAIKYNPREYRLFGNRAFCFEKMQEYEKSLTDAELSLNMCPGWVKGLFRKGRALAGLKMYEEAAQAFKEVLKLDSSCTDAAQELMRVQITQLMAYGFSREQSSNALIIHGTLDKALEVLSKLNGTTGTTHNGGLPAAVPQHPAENMAATPKPCPPPTSSSSQALTKPPHQSRAKGPAHSVAYAKSNPKPVHDQAVKTKAEHPEPQLELFPIWVGNLVPPVTESMITDLFNSVGDLHSVKLLCARRCAFVNYTCQDRCDEAIQKFNGHELMGTRITVRYPDKIPKGMGISKTALTAINVQADNPHIKECYFWRNMGCTRRPTCPYRHVMEHKGIDWHVNPKHNASGNRPNQE